MIKLPKLPSMPITIISLLNNLLFNYQYSQNPNSTLLLYQKICSLLPNIFPKNEYLQTNISLIYITSFIKYILIYIIMVSRLSSQKNTSKKYPEYVYFYKYNIKYCFFNEKYWFNKKFFFSLIIFIQFLVKFNTNIFKIKII